MANNKYITPEGKTKLLQLGFLNNTSGTFSYLALGGEGSSAAISNDKNQFSEVTGDNYHRVQLEQEGEIRTDSQSITLSAFFEDMNYNPSQGGTITEIAVVDNDENSGELDTFFAFADVPDIEKNDNISLKYSIIISIL